MPHKNVVKKLVSYGPDVAKLKELCDAYFKALSKSQFLGEELSQFLDFANSLDIQPLLTSLGQDPYCDIRELAASCLQILWTGWKDIPVSKSHASKIKKYTASLEWTWPLITSLFSDTKSGPAAIAAYVVREMECDEVGVEVCEHFRPLLLNAFKSPYPFVRLAAINSITSLYPRNEEAHSILEPAALDALIKATQDSVEKNRDWACFELHLSVANLNAAAEAAFLYLFTHETPGTEVYVEAVCGLARMQRSDLVEELICNKLSVDNFGDGWVDAAIYCHSEKCKGALITALALLQSKYPNDDTAQKIQYELEDWDEYLK